MLTNISTILTQFRKSVFPAMLALGLLLISSCTEDFLDVNDNPNALTRIEDPNLLLITGALTVINPYCGIFNEWSGTMTQYWSSTLNQSPRQPDQWTRVEDNLTFANIYDGIKNLGETSRIAKEKSQWNIYAVSEILRAFTFHYLTDIYGDIPFTEGGRGIEISKPKYDKQEEVYNGLIVILDDALAAIARKSPETVKADPVFGGNMARWEAFANSMKFRIYMRQSLKRPAVAEQGVKSLQGKPMFNNAGEEAKVTLSGAGGAINPVFRENGGRNTLRITGSPTLIGYLQNLNDPRLPAFYKDADGNANNGLQFVGWANGQNINAPASGHSAPSRPLEANAPMMLMSFTELLFLKAEAAQRGWWTGEGTPKELYDRAISASMEWWGVARGDYLTRPGVSFDTQANKLRAIAIQKWIALYGFNCLEGWFEIRRTSFPEYKGAGSIIVKPIAAINDYPRRFSYSSQEYLYNSANVNATGIPESQTDFLIPVWWDTH